MRRRQSRGSSDSKISTADPSRARGRHTAGALGSTASLQALKKFQYSASDGLHLIMPHRPSAPQRSLVPELHLGPDELLLRARDPVPGARTTVPAAAAKPEAGSRLRHAPREKHAALRGRPGWRDGRAEGGDRVRRRPSRQTNRIHRRRRRLGDHPPHLVGCRGSDPAAVAAKPVERPPRRSSQRGSGLDRSRQLGTTCEARLNAPHLRGAASLEHVRSCTSRINKRSEKKESRARKASTHMPPRPRPLCGDGWKPPAGRPRAGRIAGPPRGPWRNLAFLFCPGNDEVLLPWGACCCGAPAPVAYWRFDKLRTAQCETVAPR